MGVAAAAIAREPFREIRINRRNLYEFRPDVLDEGEVSLILEEMPRTIGERLHLFSLFHKAARLRRPPSADAYHHRIADVLSRPEIRELPQPGRIGGLDRRLHAGRVFAERVITRLDGWRRWNDLKVNVDVAVRPARRATEHVRHVLITGWYGAETAGDKAILLEIVHAIRERHPGARISLTSIVPGHSRLTNVEMGLDARIVDLRRPRFGDLASVDLVIFGGGPLMDSSQLKHIATLFRWAKRRRIPSAIFGCGVGPLKTAAGLAHARAILLSADAGFFRDDKSASEAVRLGYRGEPLHACDPALAFVDRWRREYERPAGDTPAGGIVTLLRAQTGEYSRAASADAGRLATELATVIDRLVASNDTATIEMHAMHSFWLGNDDREYNAAVAERAAARAKLRPHPETLTLDELLSALACARRGIPMRFHGHLFLMALHVPFVSVDYTGAGGKVASALERYGLSRYSVPLDEQFSADVFLRKWNEMEQSADAITASMRAHLATDLANLRAVYDRVWQRLSRS